MKLPSVVKWRMRRPDFELQRVMMMCLGLGACTAHTSDSASPPDRPSSVVDTAMDTPQDSGQSVTTPQSDWPLLLSGTGLYEEGGTEVLAPGVLAYDVAWSLWSDGATKERYLWVPPGTQIDTTDPNAWQFPLGTKAWKAFVVEGRRLETRYIEKSDAGWVWVSYLWRGDGTEADAVEAGLADVDGTSHDIPDTDACTECHQGLGLLGVDAIQLGADNPKGILADWTGQGLISDALALDATVVPGSGSERQSLGMLHGNCKGCHVDEYPLADNYGLRLWVELGLKDPTQTLAYVTGVNAPTRHQVTTRVVIDPGSPESSQLWERMNQRGLLQMPPLGTEMVDKEAVAHVAKWISGME